MAKITMDDFRKRYGLDDDQEQTADAAMDAFIQQYGLTENAERRQYETKTKQLIEQRQSGMNVMPSLSVQRISAPKTREGSSARTNYETRKRNEKLSKIDADRLLKDYSKVKAKTEPYEKLDFFDKLAYRQADLIDRLGVNKLTEALKIDNSAAPFGKNAAEEYRTMKADYDANIDEANRLGDLYREVHDYNRDRVFEKEDKASGGKLSEEYSFLSDFEKNIKNKSVTEDGTAIRDAEMQKLYSYAQNDDGFGMREWAQDLMERSEYNQKNGLQKFFGGAGDAAISGISSVSRLAATVPAAVGDMVGQDIRDTGYYKKVNDAADYFTEKNARSKELYKQSVNNNPILSGASDALRSIVEGTMQSAPYLMTGGASAAADRLGGAFIGANYSALQRAGNAAMNMAKNPGYWLSFAQEYTNQYEDAQKNGASKRDAALSALVSGSINGAIEMGFGVQANFDDVMNARGFKQFMGEAISSAIEEGGEELAQGFTGNLVDYLIWDKDKKAYSFDYDENAILNVPQMWEEFKGGFFGAMGFGGFQIIQSLREQSAEKKNIQYIAQRFISEDVGQYLSEKGSVNASDNAMNLAKVMSGQNISQKEAEAIKADQAAVQFLKENTRLNFDAGMDIGTFRKNANAVAKFVRTGKGDVSVDTQTEQENARDAGKEQMFETGETGTGTALRENRLARTELPGTENRTEQRAPTVAASGARIAVGEQVGRAVSVGEFADARNGIVRLENGETAKLSELAFDSSDRKAVYASAMKYDTETANMMIQGDNGSENYAGAFDHYYEAGRTGHSYAYTSNTAYSSFIDKSASLAAFRQGRDALLKNNAAMKELQGNRKARDTSVYFVEDYVKDRVNLTKTDQTQLDILRRMATNKKQQIRIVQTIDGGSRNALYDPKTDTITIALDARQHAYLYWAGHEITHRVKQQSIDRYDQLKNTVIGYLEKQKAFSLEDRITRLQETYRDNGIELDREGAIEEIVCNSVADVFSDETAVRELAKQDRSFVEKVKDFLDEFIQELKDTFNKITNNIPEAAAVKRDIDTLESVRKTVYAALDEIGGVRVNENQNEENIRYSANEYWYPKLTKAEWSLLNKTKLEEVDTSDKFIDNDTKWLYTTSKGVTVFAIYSTADVNDPTVLYATGSKSSLKCKIYMEMILNGEERFGENQTGTDINASRTYVSRWIKNLPNKAKGPVQNLYDARWGRAETNRNANVYGRSSGRDSGGTYSRGRTNYQNEDAALVNTLRSAKSNIKFSINETVEEYKKPITIEDIRLLREIIKAHNGERVSINDFTSEDIQRAQKWAYKYWKYFNENGVNPCISPFFRAWFGDWRAYENTPIESITVVSNTKSFANANQGSAYIKNGVKNRILFRGDTINHDTGFKINIGAQIYNDTLTYANRELSRDSNKSKSDLLVQYNDTISILENIRQICENSVLLDTVISENEDYADQSFFHHFYCSSNVDGRTYLVNLTVDELNSMHGDIRRAYNVDTIKITPVAVSQVYKPAFTTNVNGSTTSINTIADLYSIVKQYDKDFHAGKSVNPALLNENGTPKVYYHGTPNGTFNVFHDWQYFTDNSEYADVYQNQGASSNGYKKTANNSKTYAVYLTADKVFDTRKAKDREIFNREFFGKWGNGTPLSEKGLPDWTDGDDLIEFFEENGYDYDAILLDEGATGGYEEEVKSRGISVVIKESNQIKSATDNIGTFDGNNPDIRYSINEIDDYTEKEYNEYGWAKVNDVLSDVEYKKLNEQFAAIAHNKGKNFEKTPDGYYVIPVGEDDKPQNSFVFIKGSIAHPKIGQIIYINVNNETELDKIRGVLKNVRSNAAFRVIGNYFENESVFRYDNTDFGYYRELQKQAGSLRGNAQRNRGLRNGSGSNRSGREALRSEDQVNTLSDDIRDSINEDDVSEIDTNKLQMTVRQQAVIDDLRQQFELTQGHQPDRAAVEKIAKKIVKQYSSEYDQTTLTDNLMKLFDYIANGEDVEWNSVMEVSTAIANRVIEKSSALNRELYDQYKDMREYFRKTPIRIDPNIRAEVGEYAGGWNNFRRQNFGRINLTNEGNNLDSLWGEICEQFPEFFDPEAVPQAQAQQIVDALDSIAPYYENPYGMNQEEAAYDLAVNLYEDYFAVPEVKTFADKQAAKLEQVRAHLTNMQRQQRERTKERYERKLSDLRKLKAEQLDDLRKRYEAAGAKDKQLYRERIEKLRSEKNDRLMEQRAKLLTEKREAVQRQRDLRRSAELKRRIGAIMTEFNQKLLHPTKDKHIPSKLLTGMIDLCETVNGAYDNQKARNAIADLSRSYRDMRSGEASDGYSDPITADLDWLHEFLGERQMKELTPNDLQEIYDVLREVRHVVNNYNRAFMEGRKATISGLAADVIAESTANRKKHAALNYKAIDTLKKFGWANEKPIYAMRMIGSDTLTALYENLRGGEDTWAVNIGKVRDKYNSVRKKYGADEWDMKQRFSLALSDGNTLNADLGHIMSIYALSKRAQAVKHMEQGGILLKDSDVKENGLKRKTGTDTPMLILYDDVLKIANLLTDSQRKYVDEMQKYLATDMAELGNEVTMKLYDMKKFSDPNYFPIKSHSYDLNREVSENKNEGYHKIVNSGFTKDVARFAGNAIEISDFNEVWADHCNQMCLYNSFVLPLDDFARVFAYRDIASGQNTRMSLTKEFGGSNGAVKYIECLLKDVNGGVMSPGVTLNKLIGIYKKSAVFASASVVMQQPSAIARAFAMVDPKYFVQTAFRWRSYEELKKYAPIAQIKEMGYFDTNLSGTAVDWVLKSDPKGLRQKIGAFFKDGSYRDEVFSFAAAKADAITWSHLWEACKAEALDKGNYARNSEEHLKAAGKRFTEVVERTQVYDSVFSRSELMRSKDTGTKMATAFMAEPTTSYNMLVDAALQAKRNGGKGLKYAARAGSAYVASVVLNAILKSFVTAARDDDDDKSYWEKYLGNIVGNAADDLNPMSLVPVARDIVSIWQGYDVERSDMSAINDLITLGKKLIDKSEKGTVSWDDAMKFIGAAGAFAGLPITNMWRDIKSALNIKNDIESGRKTSVDGIVYSIAQQLNIDMSVDKLYEQMVNGDKAGAERTKTFLTRSGKDDKKINSGLKKLLAEDDTIREYAESYAGGNIDAIEKAMEAFGRKGFDRDTVAAAVRTYADTEIEGKDSASTQTVAGTMYQYDDLFTVVDSGIKDDTVKISKAIIEGYQQSGKTLKEAKSTVKSQLTKQYKDRYLNADAKGRLEIRRNLYNTLAYDSLEQLDKILDGWIKNP